MDDVGVEFVKDLVVTQRKTHSEVSLLLKEAYPDRRGLSSKVLFKEWDTRAKSRLIMNWNSAPRKLLHGLVSMDCL